MLHDIVKASAEAIFYHVCKGLLFVFTCELYMKSSSVVNKHNWEFLVNPKIKRNCFNSILRYSKKLFYSADICQHSQTFWSSLKYFSSTIRFIDARILSCNINCCSFIHIIYFLDSWCIRVPCKSALITISFYNWHSCCIRGIPSIWLDC